MSTGSGGAPSADRESGRPGRAPPSLGRKQLVPVALGLVAYLVALVIAFRRWDFPPLGPVVGLVLVGALAGELGAKYLLGLLFRESLARQNHHIGRRTAFAAAMVGTATARLLPAGGAVAPTTMAWAVRSEEDHAAGAALRTTMLGYGGLLLITGLSIGWAAVATDTSPAVAGTILPGLVVAGIGILVLVGSRWLDRVVAVLPSRLRRHFGPTATADRITGTEIGLVLGRIALEGGVLWLVLAGLDVEVDPARALLLFGFATLLSGLPISPGGVGAVEGGLLGALVAMGFAADAVVAPVLVYRLINYWVAAGIGLAVAGRLAAARPHSQIERPRG